MSSARLRLRAAEYYRQAFFWHCDDLDGTGLTTAYRDSVDAFRRALSDLPRTGQGQLLCNAMTCPKTFRRFTRAEGAEGHCEGMAPIVFWTAAFDWLDTTLP